MADVDMGTDVAGFEDVDAEEKFSSGRQQLGEALARRYTCPRGRLIDDPNYGEDLTAYLNDDMTVTDVAAMQTAAELEAVKDERVVSAVALAVFDTVSGNVALTITVTDGVGPFQLVLDVSAVTVKLLSVGP